MKHGQVASGNQSAGKRSLVTGMFGVPNVGDEAVCMADIHGLRAVLAGVEVHVISRSSAVSRSFTCPNACYLEAVFPSWKFWLNSWRYLRTIARSDVVIMGGGGVIQDVFHWRLAVANLFPMCAAVAFGVPAVMTGVGAGPLRRPWLRRLIGWLCNHIAAVQVRNPAAARALEGCGVSADMIRVTQDVVPAYVAEMPRRDHPTQIRRIGLALRDWPGLELSPVIRLLEEFAEAGCEVSMLCYEPRADATFYRSILSRCSSRVREQASILVPGTLDAAIDAVRQMDVMLAMRFHACIFAAYLNVPLVTMPYHHKVSEFMMELGQPQLLRSLDGSDPVTPELLRQTVRDWPTTSLAIAQPLEQIARKSADNFLVVRDAAEGRMPTRGGRIRAIGLLWLMMTLGWGYELFRIVGAGLGRLFSRR